jgi:hypothetical protein
MYRAEEFVEPHLSTTIRLVLMLDLFVGQHINCMWRVRAKLTDPSSNQRVLAANEKKHVTWYATLDGSLGKHKPLVATLKPDLDAVKDTSLRIINFRYISIKGLIFQLSFILALLPKGAVPPD